MPKLKEKPEEKQEEILPQTLSRRMFESLGKKEKIPPEGDILSFGTLPR
ncbi:MAG: hypothetical protein PHC91_03055 [Eubacteriales bacterium]|nr:hypothetical protein [Eubacteriales bacterium]